MARALKSSDLLTLRFVSDVQVSRDGGVAAWVVTDIVSGDGDGTPPPPRYRSRVHVRPLGAPARRQATEFTRGEHADTSPRISPEGEQLAFLRKSTEKGKAQLHVMPLSGGEPEKLTEHKAGVQAFAWLPDGKRIAYISLGEHEDKSAKEGLPRRMTRRYWRGDGLGALPGEPAQVYVVDVATGRSRRVTDLPESPRLIEPAPDGMAVWIAVPSGEEALERARVDIALVDLGTGVAEARVKDVLGLSALRASPDGVHLAYAASQRQEDIAAEGGVWLLDVRTPGAAPRLLSGDHATSVSAGGDSRYGAYPSAPSWTDGSAALLVLVNDSGASGLARLSLGGTLEKVQGGERVVTSFAAPSASPSASPSALPSAGEGDMQALFIAETPERPGEVYARLRDGREVQLSHENDAWRRRLELASPEGPFAAGHADAPYWLLRPKRPRSDGAAVLQVHGGPHTNYGYGFQLEFQLMAARGYAVIFGNPRGSSSYGHEFATCMLGAYGSVDADDVMAFAEAGMARLGRRGAPLHLTGGSYGGFMTNWLVGHTDRFRSAVTQRSISNWTSMYGTSDIGPWFVERELAGMPWGDFDALWRQSPIRYVENVVTPLLIVHSEEDYRCPIEQGEQLFTALKRLGKAETELFRVPGEGHELSRSGRPDRRIERLEAIVGWFERHA